ncbi:MAG: helix-turn-helix domain-containing protein [Chitinophagaceae bacterium]|jgi:AraC-like DNA-binding protein|nr:helix-turn-helix domain-containing protein [Chitinophagaceae bacterium]
MMYFHLNSESVPLLFFFINGLIFSALLIKKGFQEDSKAALWLGLFVFLCSLYLCPWMCGHAKWYFAEPYRQILFYVPTMQVLLLGPVIFFYTKSLLQSDFRLTGRQYLHLFPAAAYLVYSLVVFITDKLVLQKPFFYADGRDKDLADWYQQLGWLSMITYAVLSIRLYNRYRKLVVDAVSFADSVKFEWVKRYLVAFVLMQLCMGVFLFLYPEWGSFSNKWWYYLLFSILSFYIALQGYVNVHQVNFELEPIVKAENENTNQEAANSATSEKTANETEEKNSGLNFAEWKQKISTVIEAEQLYENPRLSLTDLAEKLQTNPTTVSKAINNCFEMNFNDFINQYRVEAVKKMLTKGLHQKQTLLGIAYDAGFNSKTTFNRAFKKNTGLAPKEFLEKMNKE